MKRFFSLMMLVVLCCMFMGCDNPSVPQQAMLDQNGQVVTQPMQQQPGMDPLAAGAIGAAGGYLAGKMMNRPSANIVQQRTVVVKKYYQRPSYRPSSYSSFRSSGYRSGGFRRR